MRVVHNPEQLMAWKPADLDRLIGKQVSIRAAADHSYWKNPYGYDGPWEHLVGGVVEWTQMSTSGLATLTYTDGQWAAWIAGQPVYVEVVEPMPADTPTA